jgi:hypothetical protein
VQIKIKVNSEFRMQKAKSGQSDIFQRGSDRDITWNMAGRRYILFSKTKQQIDNKYY